MGYIPSNPNGQANMANSAPVVISSDQSSVGVSLQDLPTGGASVFHYVTTAGNNAVNISNRSGKITGWYIYNSNGTARKLAFHNNIGTPIAGTSVYFSIVIPALSAANCSFPSGINFPLGIAMTTTSGLLDSDTSFVAANDLIINIFYKN
jgi:hypothetical protein